LLLFVFPNPSCLWRSTRPGLKLQLPGDLVTVPFISGTARMELPVHGVGGLRPKDRKVTWRAIGVELPERLVAPEPDITVFPKQEMPSPHVEVPAMPIRHPRGSWLPRVSQGGGAAVQARGRTSVRVLGGEGLGGMFVPGFRVAADWLSSDPATKARCTSAFGDIEVRNMFGPPATDATAGMFCPASCGGGGVGGRWLWLEDIRYLCPRWRRE
jgi:hypothetical protein